MPPCLLVEDSEDDIFLAKRAINKAQIKNPVHIAHDGQEAIRYLHGDGIFGDRVDYPVPALVLLDVKLPKMDGFSVIKWIRSHVELKGIPIVMLSSSLAEEGIKRASELGANAYLEKPVMLEDFEHLLRCVKTFWLDLNHVPKPSSVPEPD